MILLSAGIGLVAGPLADRYGYRWMLVIGILAISVNFAGVGLAPSYPVLLVFSVAGGVGDALVFSLPLAIVSTRFTGDAQRSAMGWVIGSLSAGPIIGGPVLTTLGDLSGWRTALIVASLATLGAAWFVAVALPIDHRQPATAFRVRDLISG